MIERMPPAILAVADPRSEPPFEHAAGAAVHIGTDRNVENTVRQPLPPEFERHRLGVEQSGTVGKFHGVLQSAGSRHFPHDFGAGVEQRFGNRRALSREPRRWNGHRQREFAVERVDKRCTDRTNPFRMLLDVE